MRKRRICAALLAVVMLASSTAFSAQAASLPTTPQEPYVVAQQTAVLNRLVVNDQNHAKGWSVREGLAVNDALFSDSSIKFTRLPAALEGSAWLQTTNASVGYKGEGALATVQVYRSGSMMIGLLSGTNKPNWMSDYEKSELSVWTDEGKLTMYEKRYESGDTVELGAVTGENSYVAIYKTDTIDVAPPTPNMTKFWTVEWDAGWYRMETGLKVGDSMYSFDYDPTMNDIKTWNPADFVIKTLPERFVGADYIMSRVNRPRDLYFFAEQDIDVYAAIDSAYSTNPSGLKDWVATGETMSTADGRTYRIAKKSFPMGQTVLIKADGQNGNTGRTCFFMVLPSEGETVYNATQTGNPLVEEGEAPAKNAADEAYTYYLNEVFNLYEGDELPAGYQGVGAALNTIVKEPEPERPTEKTITAGQNMALDMDYTVDSTSYEGSPVDGNVDTYWQNERNSDDSYGALNKSGVLTVDLEGQAKISSVVMKLRAHWGDRTQNIEIQGSTDGESFTTLVPAKDYTFEKAKSNILDSITFAETTVRYVRAIIRSNTGWSSCQLSELEVYGPAQTIKLEPKKEEETVSFDDRWVELEKTEVSAEKAEFTKTFDKEITGKVIFEGKVKSSAANQKMEIPAITDASGKKAVSLYFGEDGFIKAETKNGAINVAPYQAEAWYTLKVLIDTDSATYEVWVDHLRKVQDVPFYQNASSLKTLRFSVDAAACGKLCVDNLRLYDNPEVFNVRDQFNDAETGSVVKDGWQYSNVKKVAVAEVPFKTDKSLQLSNTDGEPVTAVRSFDAIRGDVTIEAKIKPMQPNWVTVPMVTDADGNVAVKVAFYRNSFYINNGNNWVYICNQEVPNNYYLTENWFQIKLVLNTYTNRYDFYIDGAKRYTGASFAADVDEVSRVVFRADEENELYVDNVTVYDSASLARGMYPSEQVFNVKDFGAKGDGVTDDTVAIGKAIKAAAGTGGTVLFENGVFYTGQIIPQSDMTIFLDASATLFFKMDRNEYEKIVPSRGYNGNHQLGRGLILTKEGTQNVRITGGGTLDGNGFYGFNQNDPPNQRPCALYLTLSHDLFIENINIVQSPFWTLVPYESTNVTVRNVAITNHVAPNRDGIDPVNTSNMTVENCFIIAGDDAFCPKSGNDIPTSNMDIRNVYMQSYCNGIKFGTDSYDDFKNYNFEDIWMKCVGLSGITLQACDGSEIENINFRRIDMSDVDNVLALMVGNRYRKPSGLDNSYNRLGYIRDVTIEDMNYTNPMQQPYSHKSEDVHEALIYGLDPAKNTINDGKDHRISNIAFKNVYMEMPGGATSIPNFDDGVGGGYPEHTGLGTSVGSHYTIRWADNVTFENCTNVLMNPDVRKEVAYADYTENVISTPKKALYVLGTPTQTVPIGTAADEIELPDTVQVALDNNTVATVKVASWTSKSYNANAEGAYEFTATLVASGEVAGANLLSASTTVYVTSVIPGDVDGDGSVNVSDIVKLKNLIMEGKWTSKELSAGDMNNSGKLDVADIIAVKNQIMGN